MRIRRINVVCGAVAVLILLYLVISFTSRPSSSDAGRKANSLELENGLQSPPAVENDGKLALIMYIGVVVCGQRMPEAMEMIKSALIFNRLPDKLHFLIFAEENLFKAFTEKLQDWRLLRPGEFDFEMLPLQFPAQNENVWRNLFKPCSAQRLFLPSLLKRIEPMLYVDTDTLFLSPVRHIWKFFSKFNSSQMVALSPEQEDSSIGWYNRFARHPFYGPLGVNSGVMLMNLTRMRDFNWEAQVLPIHKEYKLRITWGDQDIINILFYYHPDKLYVMPCEYNYRPDHCMYMSLCNVSEGVKVLHGNRGYFHSDNQPLFPAIYDIVENYQMGSDRTTNFLLPLREALQRPEVITSNCGKVRQDLMQAVDRLLNH